MRSKGNRYRKGMNEQVSFADDDCVAIQDNLMKATRTSNSVVRLTDKRQTCVYHTSLLSPSQGGRTIACLFNK